MDSESYRPSVIYDEPVYIIESSSRHLPGKHDQSKHGKGGKSTKDTVPMPELEKPTVTTRYPEGAIDPVTGRLFPADSGASWQSMDDVEMRAGGVWSEYYHGMRNVRQVIRNRKAGKPDMEGVNPKDGWLTQYQRVGEVQYGNNGPRLGEVLKKGDLYTEKDMGIDLRNSATVLQNKMDNAPSHKTPLYRGMRIPRNKLPKEGETFSHDISSWSTSRDSAAVHAYRPEVPSLGIVGDTTVVMRMTGQKKSAFIGDIVGSGIVNDEHIANGTFRIKRVTRKGNSANIEVEQVND